MAPHSSAPTVFPTPVGVFPWCARCKSSLIGLPHARGGVSVASLPPGNLALSSPRPWGCFSPARQFRFRLPVFPTPVGVFPLEAWGRAPMCSLPHARGGVSPSKHQHRPARLSSPRPWGCFLIAMAKEAGCVSLPHARGGVSRLSSTLDGMNVSSPRPWGCFLR